MDTGWLFAPCSQATVMQMKLAFVMLRLTRHSRIILTTMIVSSICGEYCAKQHAVAQVTTGQMMLPDIRIIKSKLSITAVFIETSRMNGTAIRCSDKHHLTKRSSK